MDYLFYKRKKQSRIRFDADIMSFRRLCVLITGLIPFLCYIMVLVEGIPIMADGKTGLAYVNTSETGLAVRLSAGTGSMLTDRLPKNSQIKVIDSAKDGRGDIWYEVEYSRGNVLRSGYVHSSYVVFYEDIAPAGEDAEFEAYLDSQGFPESYKAPLRVLHKAHPSWTFKSHKIGLTWDYVVTEESKVGVNMIHTYYPMSWRSMEAGAYDWDKKEWIYLDSGCYGASATITAYYLDPRNGLVNDTSVFQFEDLSFIPEMHNADDTYSILKGTFLAGSYSFTAERDDSVYPSYGIQSEENGKAVYEYTYTDTIMKASEKAKVSPFFIASRVRQEMGVQGSELAWGTYPGYEGYYNFFNIGAYAHDGRSARENGARYAASSGSYMRPWTNPFKALSGGADFLGSGYIRCEQNSLYLQKFDVTDGGNGRFNHQYMSNVNSPTDEASSMKRAYINSGVINTGAFVFDIPLYDSMSETASVQPASDDASATNNNWLSSISVSGGRLDRAFSRTVYEYTVTVPGGTQSVEISASVCDTGAHTIGTGKISLTSDQTKHIITVLAPSFEIRTYTLNIVRSGAAPSPSVPSDPTQPPTQMPTPSAPTPSSPTPTSPSPTVPPTVSPSPTQPVQKDPTVSSSVYKIGTYITGVAEKTDAGRFVRNFTVKDGTVQLINTSGSAKSSGFVATGDILQLYKGTSVFKTYTVLIYGDVNGDGSISLADMVMVQRQLLGIQKLDGAKFAATDVNHDSRCSLADMVTVQRDLLGLSGIKQG